MNRFLVFLTHFIPFLWLLVYFSYEQDDRVLLYSLLVGIGGMCLLFLLKRTDFMRFHFRNALGVLLVYVIDIALMRWDWLHDYVKYALGFFLVFLLLINMWAVIDALKNRQSKLPLFGDLFQKLFKLKS